MSNIEQIDFSTLTWVKTELDETLNRAKDALEAYVEDSEDTNQLQFCVTYLHQIQGTLKMVELYGAAMVAEEMELVAKELFDGNIKDVDSAYDVLMQSILQLPDYLERIELGHKDVPIVLLPLVNDLRSVRSKNLLSESALFNPNLDLGVPERILENDVSLKGKQLNTALLKIRSIYEIALLNWFKDPDNDKGLNNMQLVISKLQMILSEKFLKQLFWTYTGLVEGLLSKNIDDNISVKQLAGQVNVLIKDLIEDNPQTKSTSRAITRNMLYYIAINEEAGRVTEEIKSFFNLSQFIPDEVEIEHAEGSLSGKNKELLETVSAAINDDVLVVQESLDLFIRNQSADVEELSPLLENLQKIGDTLGILGLGIARDSVSLHQDIIKDSIENNERPTDDQLLDVAKTLLKIESQLGDHIQSLGISDEQSDKDDSDIPKSEQKAIIKTLAKESIVNLQQIKTNFVAFIESPWDKNQVQDNPKLLNEIAGAMKILNLSEAGEHVDNIIEYVNADILGTNSKPSALQLEQLATVISSLEYYLENLDQGQGIRQTLLSEVGVQIEALRHQASQDIENHEGLAEQIEQPDDSLVNLSEEHAVDDVDENIESEHEMQDESDEVTGEAEENVDQGEADDGIVIEQSSLVVEFGDDVDDEIKEVFLEEFEEELENMQAGHALWKEDPEANEEKLIEIRRIFHTLKGSGRLVGAEAIGEFGWQLENLCNRFLDGGVNKSADYKKVLQSGVEMSASLFVALQNNSVVPDDYNLLLHNAENVANNKPLTQAVALPAEAEADHAEKAADVSGNVDETKTGELVPEVVESNESVTEEFELEAIDSEVSSDEVNDSIEIAIDEGDLEISLDDEEDGLAEEEDDLSLEYVQYDVEELKNELSEGSADSEDSEDSEEKESIVDDEIILEDDLSIDLEDFDLDSIEEEVVEVDEDISEALNEQFSGPTEDEQVDGIDLNEDEIMDLESELAELADVDLDLDNDLTDQEGDSLSEDQGFDLEKAESDMDLDDDTETLLSLADSESSDASDEEGEEELDIEPDSFESDEETQSESEDDLEIDPVFIEILQKEVGGHLGDMSQFVSDSMEKEKPKVNDDFIRVVHTLNGAASMASVDGITKMTTPLEKMSIMLLGKEETLSNEDIAHIEAVITHARSQLNLLGTGEVPVDDSIGNYFVSRINELNDDVVVAKDAEDLAVESNVTSVDEAEKEAAEKEAAEKEAAEKEAAEKEAAEKEAAEKEAAEEEAAEKEAAEKEAAEKEAAEKEAAEEETFEPFQEEEPAAVADISDLDIDEELLEIFSEEASEIFDRADHQLAELEENPSSPSIIQSLQRDLHTLKGGARMAGLTQIGDLSHQLESLFETIAESDSAVEPEQQELMSQIMHKLHGMVNSDDYGLKSNIEKETKQLEDILSSDGGEIKEKSKLDEEFFDPLAQIDEPEVEAVITGESEATTPKKKSNILSGGQIKVNSELLDKLVNFAGEVSIYRSRMEQQSAELKLNIDELENTVERVRRQLRELEHETEAQIISNYQLEGDELEEDFDPLELDQFSTMQQLSRSLSESVSDLTNIQTYLQESARSSETLLIQQSRVNTELQEGLMETRLVTFNSLVPRLRRVLRTSGQELDKQAKLSVKGAEGEMDKTVLEGIQAPLEHMIRNAMVHGIEKNRKKAKKPEQGQIAIELSREATEVVITVTDDGAGINTKLLKKKAIERGIIEKGDELSEQDIVQLITHSGLSSAEEVSKLAGRGVGMDVVNNEVKRLGGSIEILSEKNQGTTFVIRLPYTLALTQAIIVQVADHRYAIPASGVQGLIRMNIDEFRRRVLEGDLGYDYAGEQYQIQELNKLLSVDSEAMVEGNQVPLVMIKSGDQGVALRVDQTYGGREIVVKSVGTQVASVPGIFGATILGDGAVVLILDIIPMHRSYMQKLEKMEADGVQVVEEVIEDKVTTIMVVDDSITMRRAGERMLSRNEFEVMTAKDGLDALNKLQEQKPDLMLLDIEMPRMDGFELATNMKASERFKDIPIIMITSRTGQKHKDRAKEIGVERYLGKPYQEIELIDNINDLLQLEDA